MKYSVIALILSAFVLMGCNPTTTVPISVQKIQVADIPPEFLTCVKPDLPNTKTLTNKQVVSLIFKYEKEIDRCVQNQTYLKKYIKSLKEQITKIQG